MRLRSASLALAATLLALSAVSAVDSASARVPDTASILATYRHGCPCRSHRMRNQSKGTHISRPGFQGRRKIATIHAGLGVIWECRLKDDKPTEIYSCQRSLSALKKL